MLFSVTNYFVDLLFLIFFCILLRLHYLDYCSETVYVLEVIRYIVTSAKEIMFSPVSVCLSVCLCVCLLAGFTSKTMIKSL